MRKTLAVVVTTLAVGAFTAPAFAAGGCGGATHSADRGDRAGQTLTAEQTTKPTQQTQVPTEQAE